MGRPRTGRGHAARGSFRRRSLFRRGGPPRCLPDRRWPGSNRSRRPRAGHSGFGRHRRRDAIVRGGPAGDDHPRVNPGASGEGAGLRGYATGTFSSRKLAKKLVENIAFPMLAAGNFPQHRTLCEFRRRHLDDFRAVFAEVVRPSRTMGLAGLGRGSVDGTKVPANASRRKAMSYGRMVKEERRRQAEIAGAAGGRRLRGGASRRRAAGGSEAARGPAGGDPGGEGTSGGRAESDGRRVGPQAWTGAQPEGRQALRAGVRRAGRDGAEQLH